MSDGTEARTCGSCYACCVHLGIAELEKHPGQSCRHLSGARGPEHRCSIYSGRPPGCARYQCAYLMGYPEIGRPSDVGFVISIYGSEGEGASLNTTIWVFDAAKSGRWQDPAKPLHRAVTAIINYPDLAQDIRIVDAVRGVVVYLRSGDIFAGRLLPRSRRAFEELKFEVSGPRIGTYRLSEQSVPL